MELIRFFFDFFKTLLNNFIVLLKPTFSKMIYRLVIYTIYEIVEDLKKRNKLRIITDQEKQLTKLDEKKKPNLDSEETMEEKNDI